MLWTLPALVLLFGIVEGAMLGIAVLARRAPTAAARWLGWLLLAVACSLVVTLVQELGQASRWPRALLLPSGLPLLFGPLLLAHVAHQVRDLRWLRGGWRIAHGFLPGAWLLLAGWLATRPAAELGALLQPAPGPARPGLIPLIKYASLLSYAVAAAWLLVGYERRLRRYVADTTPHSVWALRVLVGSMLLLALLLVLRRWWGPWISAGDLPLAVGIAAWILLAGFHGLREPAMFAALPEVGPAAPPPGDPPTAPAPEPGNTTRPPLTAPEVDALLPQLRALGEREDLLFDHALDLGRLAKALRLTPNQLSHALNAGLGQTFYEFVNGLRVRAVQARLRDPTHDGVPLLDIAFACGFSTKTTFNKTFKACTGQTPSEWRRSARTPGPDAPGPG